jgi:hypothetical protein
VVLPIETLELIKELNDPFVLVVIVPRVADEDIVLAMARPGTLLNTATPNLLGIRPCPSLEKRVKAL